ncbi:hypothetical protein M9Y10_035970 [Tritrichomonas musculus]|uniref:Uncharacterized protein n=1 Tax=Tritrichomonas musculus TaxID=1915356 RepID=A0ABR2GWG3_9EUKA
MKDDFSFNLFNGRRNCYFFKRTTILESSNSKKVTDEGIVIFFNDMQSLKKRDRIFVSAGGSSTFVSLQQSMKTWMSTCCSELQFPKAAAPSNSKLGGSLATFNWEHA